MPKTRTVEEKEMIINLKETFDDEKLKFEESISKGLLEAKNIPVPYSNVVKRTAEALKVSERSVYRISRENVTWGTVLPPKPRLGKEKIEVDSFTEGVIRRCILEAYSKKMFPTVGYVHKTLQEDPNFPRMSKASMHRVMKRQLKIKFGKFEGKPVAMDRPDIAAHRASHLRSKTKFRKEGRSFFYIDETWIPENLSHTRGWHVPKRSVLGMNNSNVHRDPWLRGVGYRFRDEMLGGISSRPTGAGKRIILLNVGSVDGFLGVGKEFIGKKNTADYHSEMNAEHFNEWFREVVATMPDRAVVVLDQASYHRSKTPETRNPTTAYRKPELIAWLESKGVAVPAEVESFWEMRVAELRDLAKGYAVPPEYEVEKIIREENLANPIRDLKLLWLPVAHCELNPIELMWAAIKREVRSRNTTFKLKDLLPIVQEVVQMPEIDQMWAAACRHVEELEEHVIQLENLGEEFICNPINPIIINLGEQSSDSESDSDSSEDSD